MTFRQGKEQGPAYLLLGPFRHRMGAKFLATLMRTRIQGLQDTGCVEPFPEYSSRRKLLNLRKTTGSAGFCFGVTRFQKAEMGPVVPISQDGKVTKQTPLESAWEPTRALGLKSADRNVGWI